MYTLAHADVKTSISVLKSDIFQVHLRLEKIRNLNKRPQSRRRSEISAIQKGTAEVDEVVKTFMADTDDQLRFQLARLLNEKMVELEEVVFTLGGNSSKQDVRPSMSRLPIWLKMMDKYIEMTSPGLCSRPPSRADIRPQKASLAASGSRSREELLTKLQDPELLKPLQKLMEKYGLCSKGLPGSSEYIASVADVLGGIIQAQSEELEQHKTELERVFSNAGVIEKSADSGDADTENSHVVKLHVVGQEEMRLRERVKELTVSMREERLKMTKDISNLRASLQASKKSEEGGRQEGIELKTGMTTALNRISELEDILKLERLEWKKSLEIASDKAVFKEVAGNANLGSERASNTAVTEVAGKSRNPEHNYSWVLTQMMQSHEEALELQRGKSRKLVGEVMQLQDTNLELMRRLTTRDTKIKTFRQKDALFHEVMKTEMEAMKSAFECRIEVLLREVELSRSECRKVTAQLNENHKSQQSALSARGKLFKYQLISEERLAATRMNKK